MRAPLLALLGLLIAATPAFAARNGSQATSGQRAKVTAPAHATNAARPTASAGRSQAAAPARSSRTATVPSRGSRSAAAAPRGRAAQAAPSRTGGRHAAASSRHAAQYAATSTACRGNARNCRMYRVAAPQPMRWSQGLSPALNVQTSNCPAGTMATLATGHSNIVRCMPI